ncbi:alpha/beta hydrolase [Streptomyces sp. NPDC023838]|uniref:alpha/beta hydrolase n=1 Tax=Streptomyces sp. NPDC023838 TaxID=3154325 RepID=UPI0033E3F487
MAKRGAAARPTSSSASPPGAPPARSRASCAPARPARSPTSHSYGSTVVGDASNRGKLAADDIVVAGSPGMAGTPAV